MAIRAAFLAAPASSARSKGTFWGSAGMMHWPDRKSYVPGDRGNPSRRTYNTWAISDFSLRTIGSPSGKDIPSHFDERTENLPSGEHKRRQTLNPKGMVSSVTRGRRQICLRHGKLFTSGRGKPGDSVKSMGCIGRRQIAMTVITYLWKPVSVLDFDTGTGALRCACDRDRLTKHSVCGVPRLWIPLPRGRGVTASASVGE